MFQSYGAGKQLFFNNLQKKLEVYHKSKKNDWFRDFGNKTVYGAKLQKSGCVLLVFNYYLLR